MTDAVAVGASLTRRSACHGVPVIGFMGCFQSIASNNTENFFFNISEFYRKQLGTLFALGAGSRRFKSSRPDQITLVIEAG